MKVYKGEAPFSGLGLGLGVWGFLGFRVLGFCMLVSMCFGG